MHTATVIFPSGTTDFVFEAAWQDLEQLAPPATSILITDEHVAALHGAALSRYRTLIIPAGEGAKTLQTIGRLADELIALGAHRKTMLVGLGGGVVTDITGFLASTFLRGVPFAFIPTTVLGMVDAAIGGKNGVNLGLHKNMLGTIRQPCFILYNSEVLRTLPDAEWSNGFAEIIKYGFIADTHILEELTRNDLRTYQQDAPAMARLIEACVAIKNRIVTEDEHETGLRKTLNFGHTAGHALELSKGLPHGAAVGLGMIIAIRLSAPYCGLPESVLPLLHRLLDRYGLPVHADIDREDILQLMQSDKKRNDHGIDYVLLDAPGHAVLRTLKPDEIAQWLHF